jgi:hypothetical protein
MNHPYALRAPLKGHTNRTGRAGSSGVTWLRWLDAAQTVLPPACFSLDAAQRVVVLAHPH